MREWQVGELARRTGLTVRTLHHYHAIGLLSPSRRSAAGYRLYGEADVARLHRIISLRQLGLSLEQVAESLSLPGSSIGQVLRLQVERLRERMEAERRLCERLESIVRRVEQATGRRVRPYRVAESPSRGRSEVSGDQVRIYRPGRRSLESVHAGRRGDQRGEAHDSTPYPPRNGARESAPPTIFVAPRVHETAPPNDRRIREQNQRQHQQLDKYLASERQRLEREHQQELSRAKDASERQRLDQRHQAELQALEQQQREAAQQLAARQEAMRQAQSASHGNARGQQERQKASNRGQEKKDKHQPPPPPRPR